MFIFLLSILSIIVTVIVIYAIFSIITKSDPIEHPPASKPEVLKSIIITGKPNTKDYDKIWR